MQNKTDVERFRNNRIYIRVSGYERDIIMHNFEESGMPTFQDFAIKLLSDGYVINMETADLHRYAYEINKIGVNINQIAHRINMVDKDSPDIFMLKQDAAECVFLMNELTKIVRRHWMS